MPTFAHIRRDERGQTMVELALVLPIVCLLLVSILQLGLVFRDYVALTDAVRAGARQAAVDRQLADPVGDATARVRTAASDLDQSKLSVVVESDWQPGHTVAVTGTYPYSLSLLGVVVKSGVLSSSTTERVE